MCGVTGTSKPSRLVRPCSVVFHRWALDRVSLWIFTVSFRRVFTVIRSGFQVDLSRNVANSQRFRATIWLREFWSRFHSDSLRDSVMGGIFDNANYGQNESRDTLAWDNVILARCRRDFYIARWMNLQSKRSSTRGLWPRPNVLEGLWPLHGPP